MGTFEKKGGALEWGGGFSNAPQPLRGNLCLHIFLIPSMKVPLQQAEEASFDSVPFI